MCPVRDVEFGKHHRHMIAHGFLGDPAQIRYCAVAKAAREAVEHLCLAPGQRIERDIAGPARVSFRFEKIADLVAECPPRILVRKKDVVVGLQRYEPRIRDQ